MTFEMLEERGSIPGVEECIKDGVEEVVLTLLALFSSVRGRRRALNNPSNRGSSRFSGCELKCASMKSWIFFFVSFSFPGCVTCLISNAWAMSTRSGFDFEPNAPRKT
jgi:hypothetical protein